MKCLTCFFVLCQLCHIAPSLISARTFPSCFKPNFTKTLCVSSSPCTAQLRAQCPIKLSYPCRKESFRSLPHSVRPLNPSLILFPPVLNYPSLTLLPCLVKINEILIKTRMWNTNLHLTSAAFFSPFFKFKCSQSAPLFAPSLSACSRWLWSEVDSKQTNL